MPFLSFGGHLESSATRILSFLHWYCVVLGQEQEWHQLFTPTGFKVLISKVFLKHLKRLFDFIGLV